MSLPPIQQFQTHQSYHIYPKYSDTSTPYHICSKIWTSTIHYPMLCLKIAGWVANSIDPDETPHSAASHLGLYCLLRPVCPNTYGKYGSKNGLVQILVQKLFWKHHKAVKWTRSICLRISMLRHSGPSCSKLMMLLVNILFKLWLLNKT